MTKSVIRNEKVIYPDNSKAPELNMTLEFRVTY